MTTDPTTCSPEQPCGHCHPEHIGQRCTIDYLRPGIILVTGSQSSGELHIDVTGSIPAINGVRIPSSRVLAQLSAVFATLATQRSGMERPDETLTQATIDLPHDAPVRHVGSGRTGVVKGDDRYGIAHYTNVHGSVRVRVAMDGGGVSTFRPAELVRTDVPADAAA